MRQSRDVASFFQRQGRENREEKLLKSNNIIQYFHTYGVLIQMFSSPWQDMNRLRYNINLIQLSLVQ